MESGDHPNTPFKSHITLTTEYNKSNLMLLKPHSVNWSIKKPEWSQEFVHVYQEWKWGWSWRYVTCNGGKPIRSHPCTTDLHIFVSSSTCCQKSAQNDDHMIIASMNRSDNFRALNQSLKLWSTREASHTWWNLHCYTREGNDFRSCADAWIRA